MEHFTPISALLGGALIGLAASLLLVTIGRIAGVSGILAGTIAPASDGRAWRLAFAVGLVGGAALVRALSPQPVPITMVVGPAAIVLAGLAVGVGTRLGNGCTSGHGVCGMARLSTRSIVATLTFMLTGGLTVFLVRHVIGG
jgi:uncharacterized protein